MRLGGRAFSGPTRSSPRPRRRPGATRAARCGAQARRLRHRGRPRPGRARLSVRGPARDRLRRGRARDRAARRRRARGRADRARDRLAGRHRRPRGGEARTAAPAGARGGRARDVEAAPARALRRRPACRSRAICRAARSTTRATRSPSSAIRAWSRRPTGRASVGSRSSPDGTSSSRPSRLRSRCRGAAASSSRSSSTGRR